MKVFETTNGCAKLNIVDDHNVFVGFDYSQNCCEDFGYKVTKEEPKSWKHLEELLGTSETDFPGFNFDINYAVSFSEDADWVAGNAVVFRGVSDAGEYLYFTLKNSHNGYYSHGFEMKDGDTLVFKGDL